MVEDVRRALGIRGEELALAHLCALGFQLVARNHRSRFGEIDLIVCDGRALVFVEVKTRRTRQRQIGESASRRDVTAASAELRAATDDGRRQLDQLLQLSSPRRGQRRRLRRTAAQWLAQTRGRPVAGELRFDFIGVVVDGDDRLVRLDHLEGAL